MLVTWTCMLLATAVAHKVVESTEDLDPATAAAMSNTTTLYPVKPINRTDTKQRTATSWKIETTFGESKLDSNGTDSKEQLVLERPSNSSSSQEFKPSPHLENYLEDDSFELGPTRPTPFAGVIKKPPTGFISSLREHKFPQEVFKNYQKLPYSIESPIITKAKDEWRPSVNSLESKPTDEAPVRVPAGGLYKQPDPFKIKPGTTDEDFGLEFSGDAKEHPVKKRMNPMKNLLHLITALIPVGIIFSALTPSLITIEPDSSIPPNVFRRADGSFASVPPISERCRRRLLCELHSETNYHQSRSSKYVKQCHRIRCEDPETLTKTLHWLLSHSPTSGLNGRPTYGQNGQHPDRPTNGHIDVRPTEGFGQRPTGNRHVKHRPNDGYGTKYSYRPSEGDTGDHFNADFT